MTGTVPVLLADHDGRLEPALAAQRPVLPAARAEDALATARDRGVRVAVVHGRAGSEGGVSLAGRLVPAGIAVVLALPAPDASALAAALRAGVRVVIDPSAAGRRLARALTAAERGEILVEPHLGTTVAALLEEPRDPFAPLSPRERELLARLTAETDVRRLAAELGLSRKTVRHHIARIVAKLGAADAADAARTARAAGLSWSGAR